MSEGGGPAAVDGSLPGGRGFNFHTRQRVQPHGSARGDFFSDEKNRGPLEPVIENKSEGIFLLFQRHIFLLSSFFPIKKFLVPGGTV